VKLSIITVCYNAELTIAETLKSIENSISRTGEYEVEHIIIDGGSKDNTVSLVECFCEKNKYAKFISESDKGIYDAYNKGLSLAVGEYVWFVNADDVIKVNAVDIISKKLNRYKDIDVFCFSISRVNSDKGATNTSIRDEHSPIKVLSPVCHTPGVVWNAELLRNIDGFDISYKICADFKSLQLLLANTNVKFKGFKDVVIDMYLGGVSSQYRFEYLKAIEQIRVVTNTSFSSGLKSKAKNKIVFKFLRNVLINPIWSRLKHKLQ